MNKKKLILITINVIVFVLFAFFIKENFYKIKNGAEYIYSEYIRSDIKQTLIDNNYKKNVNYDFVKINNNTDIKSKEDLKNAIYTFLDAGWEEYIVKCNNEYEKCLEDTQSLSKDTKTLAEVSSFVHPYNSYNKIYVSMYKSGKIKLSKEAKYNKGYIDILNNKVDEIYNENYDSSKNTRENIKIFHDYIINNTKYDKEGNYTDSSNAYGVLVNGYGICSGYTEAMQLFLEKLNVKNYRITSEKHQWNLIFLEGKWINLDLTWDDPLTSDGSDKLKYDYFLIDTPTLLGKEDNEHIFDTTIYSEAK